NFRRRNLCYSVSPGSISLHRWGDFIEKLFGRYSQSKSGFYTECFCGRYREGIKRKTAGRQSGLGAFRRSRFYGGSSIAASGNRGKSALYLCEQRIVAEK